MILSRVNGEDNSNQIVDQLLPIYRVDRKRLVQDVRILLDSLTQNYMLNWKYISKYKFVEITLNFCSQYKKGYRERLYVADTRFIFIFSNIFFIVLKKVGFFGYFITAITYIFAFVLDASSLVSLANYYTALFTGLISSYTLHETSHIYSYRKAKGSNRVGFVAADWMSVKVIRSKDPIKPLLFVTLLGPLVPAVVGIIGLISMNLMNQDFATELGVFFFMYATHFLYLLPFWGDGKSLLQQLLLLRVKKKAKGV